MWVIERSRGSGARGGSGGPPARESMPRRIILMRDRVLELVVGALGEIDRAHAAAAETLFDRVRAQQAADVRVVLGGAGVRAVEPGRLGSRKKRRSEPRPPTATRPPAGAPDRRHTACPAGRNAVQTGCSSTRASTSLTRTQDGMVVPNHTAGQRDAGRVAMDLSSRAPARMS